jgi:riboflavin synthase
MFSGLVQARGRIAQVDGSADGGIRALVQAPRELVAAVQVGDSICVNGVCLTATTLQPDAFTVDISRASLECTVGLDAPGAVNLELSLRLGDRLGGHLVFGHVDGVGEVLRFEPVASVPAVPSAPSAADAPIVPHASGTSWELVLRAPNALARFLAAKGSVTVNGVSLTINRVTDRPGGCEFSINLIPHTVEVTTLRDLVPGARVNLEIDMIARYVERMLQGQSTTG